MACSRERGAWELQVWVQGPGQSWVRGPESSAQGLCWLLQKALECLKPGRGKLWCEGGEQICILKAA